MGTAANEGRTHLFFAVGKGSETCREALAEYTKISLSSGKGDNG